VGASSSSSKQSSISGSFQSGFWYPSLDHFDWTLCKSSRSCIFAPFSLAVKNHLQI
jgi:hypothetical protein